MRSLFVFALCFQALSAEMHSWKAFYTGSTGLTEFPEFVAVNLLDDEVMGYFDSKTNTFESKQSWMMETLGQQYVERQTNILRGHQPTFKNSIHVLMERFNRSKGVHLYQNMYGCEWDDETEEVSGYHQFGYDGEDFVALDLKRETWIAPSSQAFITKNKWDADKAFLANLKNYHTQECPEWLKKYVDYGKSSLLRTVLPTVSFLQKTPSSPVTCHATGFYPNKAMLFWRKDGDELHEDVDHGETLPNHDGTFQMSTDLRVSSIPPEDWGRYDCVFQLSGAKDEVKVLDKDAVESNTEKPMDMTTTIIIAAVAVVLAIVIAAAAFLLYKRFSVSAKSSPSPASSIDVTEDSNKGLLRENGKPQP